jgi:hypothetical protein
VQGRNRDEVSRAKEHNPKDTSQTGLRRFPEFRQSAIESASKRTIAIVNNWSYSEQLGRPFPFPGGKGGGRRS